MPELAWQARLQGGYSDRELPAPAIRPAGPCTWHTDTDGTCGQPSAAVYLVGPRCPDHTPAALNGRPEPGRTAGHTPSPFFDRPEAPRHFPDDECETCVHCRRRVAPVNAAMFGVPEHVACAPPPRYRRRAVTVWAEGDPEPWSRELVEARTAQLATRNRKAA